MSTRVIGLGRKPRISFLLLVLWAVMALFIGILIYVWIETKKANPVMLDERGRVRAAIRIMRPA